MQTGCTNLTKAASVVHQLKIEGYSATKVMGSGKYIKSRWNVDGYDWEIHLYPSTEHFVHSYFQQVVGVKLIFAGDTGPQHVVASLRCQLVDPSGMLEPSEEKCLSGIFDKPTDKLFLFIMEESVLATSGYVKDDSLTVQCTITVIKELVPDIVIAPVKEVPLPSSNLHQHLGELLQKETGVDVTFVVSGEPFAAHKLILAARSPVFMAEFFGHMKEKSFGRVEVHDMEAAVFKAMLHFIYTDTVPELDEQLEEAMAMAQHLLAAADRYGLDRLKVICEGKLSGGINVDTAAMTLALAEQHNCSLLKDKCVEFIVRTQNC